MALGYGPTQLECLLQTRYWHRRRGQSLDLQVQTNSSADRRQHLAPGQDYVFDSFFQLRIDQVKNRYAAS
jgi:hypothetical protein